MVVDRGALAMMRLPQYKTKLRKTISYIQTVRKTAVVNLPESQQQRNELLTFILYAPSDKMNNYTGMYFAYKYLFPQ